MDPYRGIVRTYRRSYGLYMYQTTRTPLLANPPIQTTPPRDPLHVPVTVTALFEARSKDTTRPIFYGINLGQ